MIDNEVHDLTKQKSLKFNFIMNAMVTISSVIFPLITFPYISRVLGPVGTGKVAFATSLITYFNMFAQLGIPTYGIRVCAQVRDDKEKLSRTAHELLFINLITCMVSYVTFAIILLNVSRLHNDKIIYVIISSSILLNAIGMEWLYQALEQYAYIATRSIIFKLLALCSMFLLIHNKEDYVMYGAISIIAASASNIFNFFHAKKYIFIKPVGDYHPWKHFSSVMVFFSMACAATIYVNLDSVMLGFIKGDMDVGYYTAAVKIRAVLVGCITALGTVLLPRASYFIEHKMYKEFWSISRKALNFVIIVASPVLLYFVLYAKYGIYFISGVQYEKSILPMQIITPTLLFIGLTNILGLQILVPLNQEKKVLYSEIVGAIVNLILNTLLIPRFGVAGAAFGTLIAEFSVLFVQFCYLKRDIDDIVKSFRYKLVFISLLLGTVASYWITFINLSIFFTLLLTAVLFFGVYGGCLLINKEPFITDLFKQTVAILKKFLLKKCIKEVKD